MAEEFKLHAVIDSAAALKGAQEYEAAIARMKAAMQSFSEQSARAGRSLNVQSAAAIDRSIAQMEAQQKRAFRAEQRVNREFERLREQTRRQEVQSAEKAAREAAAAAERAAAAREDAARRAFKSEQRVNAEFSRLREQQVRAEQRSREKAEADNLRRMDRENKAILKQVRDQERQQKAALDRIFRELPRQQAAVEKAREAVSRQFLRRAQQDGAQAVDKGLAVNIAEHRRQVQAVAREHERATKQIEAAWLRSGEALRKMQEAQAREEARLARQRELDARRKAEAEIRARKPEEQLRTLRSLASRFPVSLDARAFDAGVRSIRAGFKRMGEDASSFQRTVGGVQVAAGGLTAGLGFVARTVRDFTNGLRYGNTTVGSLHERIMAANAASSLFGSGLATLRRSSQQAFSAIASGGTATQRLGQVAQAAGTGGVGALQVGLGGVITAANNARNGLNIVATGIHNVAGVARGVIGTIFNVKTALLGLATGLGVGASIKGAVQLGDEYTRLQGKLGLVTKNAEEQQAAFSDIFDTAQRLRLPVEDLAGLYFRLSNAGKAMNATSDQTTALLKSLGAAFKTAHLTGNEARSVMLQFSQAMQKGRFDGDEFRTMLELFPPFLDVLTEKTGKSRAELIKMSRDGKLAADVVANALLDARRRLEAQAQSVPRTFSDAVQQVKNELLSVVGSIANSSGMIDQFNAALDRIRAALRSSEFKDGLIAAATAVAELTRRVVEFLAKRDAIVNFFRDIGVAGRELVGGLKDIGSGKILTGLGRIFDIGSKVAEEDAKRSLEAARAAVAKGLKSIDEEIAAWKGSRRQGPEYDTIKADAILPKSTIDGLTRSLEQIEGTWRDKMVSVRRSGLTTWQSIDEAIDRTVPSLWEMLGVTEKVTTAEEALRQAQLGRNSTTQEAANAERAVAAARQRLNDLFANSKNGTIDAEKALRQLTQSQIELTVASGLMGEALKKAGGDTKPLGLDFIATQQRVQQVTQAIRTAIANVRAATTADFSTLGLRGTFDRDVAPFKPAKQVPEKDRRADTLKERVAEQRVQNQLLQAEIDGNFILANQLRQKLVIEKAITAEDRSKRPKLAAELEALLGQNKALEDQRRLREQIRDKQADIGLLQAELSGDKELLASAKTRREVEKAITDDMRARSPALAAEYEASLKTEAALKRQLERHNEIKAVSMQVLEQLYSGISDAVSGTKKWAEAMREVLANMIRTVVQAAILKPLMENISNNIAKALGGGSGGGGIFGGLFGGLFGGGASANLGTGAIASGGFLAQGGVLSGGVRAFASGGIVNRPTLFPMKRGMGLMGEAGPEAIMPVRMIGGRPHVKAARGGALPLTRDGGILSVGGSGAMLGGKVKMMQDAISGLPGNDPFTFLLKTVMGPMLTNFGGLSGAIASKSSMGNVFSGGAVTPFATGGIVMPAPYVPASVGGGSAAAPAAQPLTVNMNIHIAGDATDATVEKFRSVAVGEIQRAVGPIVNAAVAKTRVSIRRDPSFARR